MEIEEKAFKFDIIHFCDILIIILIDFYFNIIHCFFNIHIFFYYTKFQSIKLTLQAINLGAHRMAPVITPVSMTIFMATCYLIHI